MTRIAVVVIAMILFAASLSSSAAPGAAPPDEGIPPGDLCIPNWVQVGADSGWACHEEAPYWVAVGTTWHYLIDDECNRPPRSTCDEWYHPDTLFCSYEECCAAHGGCTVPVCYQ